MLKTWREFRRRLKQLSGTEKALKEMRRRAEFAKDALGRVEYRQIAEAGPSSLSEAEFSVYSPVGADGLLFYLTRKVPMPRPVFVELSHRDYRRSQTLFLLKHGWSGLFLNPHPRLVNEVKQSDLYWRHNLKAVYAVSNRSNINRAIMDQGLEDEIGVLAIDLEGHDYWIWEAIHIVKPAIVAIGYNARFGAERAVAIRYERDARTHPSGIGYGASLRALWLLGRRKGYALVGCNRAGSLAFFVKENLRPDPLPALTPEEAYREAQLTRYRDESGQLRKIPRANEEQHLSELPLVDLDLSENGL